MTYLLDTNIVSFFLQASRETELATASDISPMAIVGEVRDELRGDKNRGGANFTKWLAGSRIAVTDILVGSGSATRLAQLVSDTAMSRDLGERASIALASFDPTLIFVTHDKNAAWLALRELWAPGDRVLRVASFLRRLFQEKALTDAAVADDIIAYGEPRPAWWAEWRASL